MNQNKMNIVADKLREMFEEADSDVDKMNDMFAEADGYNQTLSERLLTTCCLQLWIAILQQHYTRA
jgi:hypothetical protein